MNKPTTINELFLADVRNQLLRARSNLWDLLDQNPQYSIGRKHLLMIATKQISQAINNIAK